MLRYVGIDAGAETLKVAELVRRDDGALELARHAVVEHRKHPGPRGVELLRGWDWGAITHAAATGRLARQFALERLPTKQALMRGFRVIHGAGEATVVSIGARGFAVLELRAAGEPVWREGPRCAQGTGNFLRQLTERFGLSVADAARRCEGVEDAVPLSGRCPVILKTDMTHLANRGEGHERILAGLLDAIAESVEVLVKPRRSPPRVLLTGGVARSRRVREHFRTFLARSGMALLDVDPEATLLLEAIGCAAWAAESGARPAPLEHLVRTGTAASVNVLPPLARALPRVRRMRAPASGGVPFTGDVVLGFDVGSTGSKLVALDPGTGESAWEGYVRTSGDPVSAAQTLMRRFLEGRAGGAVVHAVGATGSGRDIVGSLLATCYGPEAVFVLNEIAAHARGAVQHDPRVDTIFELGGQDAKYVRVAEGRVVDAAMNEACSAGTGSFIEEQGTLLDGVEDIARLGEIAMAADGSAELGQHCSVFMAEVIDEAVAAGVPRDQTIAGLYESVVANYLNRVKGARPVGQVVFCQGMPFAADALAAAVARQTGAEVVVPPNPGTIGALGIALLAAEALPVARLPPLDARRLLAARVEARDTFVCRSTQACGGAGNKCRIDRLVTLLDSERRRHTWGGGCSLHDRGTRRRKLPVGTPDPFRERAALVDDLVRRLAPRGGRRVALADAFQLKGLFPFFATFLHALGLDLDVAPPADRAHLQRGLEGANVPFCAPMQQFHGLAACLAERDADLVFAPMLREIPRGAGERSAQLCPIEQASADVLVFDLGPAFRERLISTVVDVGPGPLDAPQLQDACRRIAKDAGVRGESIWRRAWAEARAEQLAFDDRLLELGRAALERCARDGIVPVVVLGRTYTIHDDILNSNVPSILREQGAVGIPLDCYPVAPDVPLFPNMYWGHGQRILRAAWQVRRTTGTYALFTSNYSCGPDSFTLPFVSELMDGKPFAVIETDGHAGDAGTKTRVEAFLHCVEEHRRRTRVRPPRAAEHLTVQPRSIREIAASGERVLVPSMGPAADVLAAALRGMGIPAEALPEPGVDALHAGRRHTSGKECLPMTLTLGSLLLRLEAARGTDERFAFVMPGTSGPCRFGAYKELHQLMLDRLGWRQRARLWSPPFGDYFQGTPPGFGALVLAGTFAADALGDLLREVRPREARPGVANAIYARWHAALLEHVERAARGDVSTSRLLHEAATGRVYGLPALLTRAASEFRSARRPVDLPVVLVVGEIYVRNVPFANGGAVEALEQRGLATRVAGVGEFLQYSEWCGARQRRQTLGDRLDHWVRHRIELAVLGAAAKAMGWPPPVEVGEVVNAARPYVRDALEGEAVLTVGAALYAWRHRQVDAVLVLGPLECMPNKVAETQLVHAGEREGLPSLTLSLNGDPIDPEPLDGFAVEIHDRLRARA